MILVVGSTGEMGRETVKQLLAAGIPVRAMTRTPEKAQDLQRLGAEVVQGDLIDRPSLQKACKGMKGVVSAAHQLMGSAETGPGHPSGGKAKAAYLWWVQLDQRYHHLDQRAGQKHGHLYLVLGRAAGQAIPNRARGFGDGQCLVS